MAIKDIRNPKDTRPWPGEAVIADNKAVKSPQSPQSSPPSSSSTGVMIDARAPFKPVFPLPRRFTSPKPIQSTAQNISIAKTKLPLTPENLMRKNKVEKKDLPKEPPPVSLGAVEKGMDLAFNPTREKLREVTIVDRLQGRLFPVLDMIITMRQHVLEVAIFRQSPDEYKKLFDQEEPVTPNLLDEFLYRTAQWQKSVLGTNLTKITDIALAEVESQSGDNDLGSKDPWNDRGIKDG